LVQKCIPFVVAWANLFARVSGITTGKLPLAHATRRSLTVAVLLIEPDRSGSARRGSGISGKARPIGAGLYSHHPYLGLAVGVGQHYVNPCHTTNSTDTTSSVPATTSRRLTATSRM